MVGKMVLLLKRYYIAVMSHTTHALFWFSLLCFLWLRQIETPPPTPTLKTKSEDMISPSVSGMCYHISALPWGLHGDCISRPTNGYHQ